MSDLGHFLRFSFRLFFQEFLMDIIFEIFFEKGARVRSESTKRKHTAEIEVEYFVGGFGEPASGGPEGAQRSRCFR